MLPMRDEQQTTNEQLKIELLSQWKLEAESRNFSPQCTSDGFLAAQESAGTGSG